MGSMITKAQTGALPGEEFIASAGREKSDWSGVCAGAAETLDGFWACAFSPFERLFGFAQNYNGRAALA